MLALAFAAALSQPLWLTIEGEQGPGRGKHIVLLAGDEEYRSEEALPQLARILAKRHGFKCTVLFSVNKEGMVDPEERGKQPGLDHLQSADLCVMMLRFRSWTPSDMKHFDDYFRSGKPIIALRTSTHAFDLPADHPYEKYGWRSKTWVGGFGKTILGETWVSHWGNHGSQATRGVISAPKHPIMSGVSGVFGTTDVYEAAPPGDAQVLMRGEVVEGMNPTDPMAKALKKKASGKEQELNDPMMPIVWLRVLGSEQKQLVLTCTMGAATDFSNEGLRRMLVNASYFLTGLQSKIQPYNNVDLVGSYNPSPFGFGGFIKGVRPDSRTIRSPLPFDHPSSPK